MMPGQPYNHQKIQPPAGIADVPRYLRELLGGFFTRFGYIVTLVWRTGWWILLLLSFVALFRGVSPVIGALEAAVSLHAGIALCCVFMILTSVFCMLAKTPEKH